LVTKRDKFADGAEFSNTGVLDEESTFNFCEFIIDAIPNHPHEFNPNGSTEKFLLVWLYDTYILDNTSTLLLGA